jgi:hypothetical protein
MTEKKHTENRSAGCESPESVSDKVHPKLKCAGDGGRVHLVAARRSQ